MTEKTPPRVQVLEYLRTHGDSKVTAVQRGVGMSETTARKWLTTLVSEGAAIKVGQHYQVLHDDTTGDAPKPRKQRVVGTRRDPEVIDRDERVYSLLSTIDDDGHMTRNDVAGKLNLSASHAYLSLWRLCRAGCIEQVSVGTREPGWRVLFHRDGE